MDETNPSEDAATESALEDQQQLLSEFKPTTDTDEAGPADAEAATRLAAKVSSLETEVRLESLRTGTRELEEKRIVLSERAQLAEALAREVREKSSAAAKVFAREAEEATASAAERIAAAEDRERRAQERLEGALAQLAAATELLETAQTESQRAEEGARSAALQAARDTAEKIREIEARAYRTEEEAAAAFTEALQVQENDRQMRGRKDEAQESAKATEEALWGSRQSDAPGDEVEEQRETARDALWAVTPPAAKAQPAEGAQEDAEKVPRSLESALKDLYLPAPVDEEHGDIGTDEEKPPSALPSQASRAVGRAKTSREVATAAVIILGSLLLAALIFIASRG